MLLAERLSDAENLIRRLLRLAIVPAALLVVALLALNAVKHATWLWLVVAALVAWGAAELFVRAPGLGLAAVIAGSLVVPVAIGTGTESSLNITFLLLGLLLGLWLVTGIGRRSLGFIPSRTFIPLICLAAVALVAFLMGSQPLMLLARTASARAQIGGLSIFILSAAAYLLMAHQVRDVRWLQRLTWLYLGLVSLYFVGRLVPPLWAYTTALFQHGTYSGSVFWIWTAALAFSQAAFNQRLRPVGRVLLAILVLVALYAAFFQARGWSSGWLPAVVAIGVILWGGAPRLALFLSVACGLYLWLNQDQLIASLMAGDNEYSLMTRTEAWAIMFEIIKAHPLLGVGPANYYFYTPLFPILGYAVSFNSHNNYIDILAQTGTLGLLCFLWFAVEVGLLAWRLSRTATPGFARAYALGALGGLAGMLVAGMLGDWVLPFVYNVGLSGFRGSALGWLFLGGVVALEQAERRQGMQEAA